MTHPIFRASHRPQWLDRNLESPFAWYVYSPAPAGSKIYPHPPRSLELDSTPARPRRAQRQRRRPAPPRTPLRSAAWSRRCPARTGRSTVVSKNSLARLTLRANWWCPGSFSANKSVWSPKVGRGPSSCAVLTMVISYCQRSRSAYLHFLRGATHPTTPSPEALHTSIAPLELLHALDDRDVYLVVLVGDGWEEEDKTTSWNEQVTRQHDQVFGQVDKLVRF